jgi:hypothetical protein
VQISEVRPGDLLITTDFLESELQLVLRVDHNRDLVEIYNTRLGRVEHYRLSWVMGCEKVCGSQ